MPTFREDPKIGTKVPLIKTADLNDKSVTEKKLADGSITKDKIATGAVTSEKLQHNAVTTETINDGAVTSEKIAEGAVSVDEIKDLSVEESKINNKAVTNVKIDDAAVDTRTIEDKSVTNAKIADESITQEKIFNSSVTTEKLADESVSAEKLQSGLRSTIISTHEKAIELDKKKANVTDVDYALECLENKIGDRVVVEGNVTNLPDDEDLTSVSTIDGREVMRLNDRAYEPSNFSGKGYKILRKNIQRLDLPTVTILVSNIPSSSGDITITINGKATTVALDVATDTTTAIIATKIGTALKSSLDDYDVSVSSNTIVLTRNNSKYASPSSIDVGNTTAGITVKDSITKSERKNVLTQDMINEPNTVYEIRYDFDLNNETINILHNCSLQFIGGSIANGHLIGNHTGIKADLYQIFKKSLSVEGSWNVLEAKPQWFGAIGDGEKDCTEAFKSLFYTFDSVYIPEGVYNVSDTLYIKGNTSIRGTEKSIIAPIKNVNLFLVNRDCYLQNFIVNIPIIYSCNVFSITSEIIDREGPLYNRSLNTVFKNIKIHYKTNSDAAIIEPLGTSFHFEAGKYSNASINVGWWGVIVENCVSIGRYGYFMKCFSPQSGYITKVIVNNCFLDGALYGFFMAPDESKIGDLEYKERTTLNINTVTSESYSFSKRFAYITGACFIHDCLPFDWIAKAAPYLLLNTTFSEKCIISPIYGSVYRNFEITNYENTSNLVFMSKLSGIINSTNNIVSSNLSYYNTLAEVTSGDNYCCKRTIEAIRYEHTINKNKYIFITFPIQKDTDDLRLVINTLISTRTSFYMYRFAINIANLQFITANDIDYGVRGYYGKSDDNTKVYIAFEFLEDTNNVCIATNFYFLGYSILQNFDIKATIQISDSIPDGFTKYNIKNGTIKKGKSSERPILQSKDSSFQYYDTELKKYIVWNGTGWTNMDGTALE